MKTSLYFHKSPYHILWILVLFFCNTTQTWAQTVSGPTSITVGTTHTYTLSGVTSSNTYWSVSPGATITGSGTYSANIQATTGANFTITAAIDGGSGGYIGLTVSVTPNAPAVPNSSNTNACTVSLQANGSAPTGVAWFWQGTNSNGTSIDFPATTNYIATANGTYYINARNSSGNWSATSTAKSVTQPPKPNEATGSNPSAKCYPGGTFTLTATPGTNGNAIRWYSAASGGTLLHTGNSYTTPNLTSTTTYYAESYNITTNCKANTRKSFTAQVFPTLFAGDIYGNHTICYNGDPDIINNYSYPSGGNGTYAYQWQYSDTGNSPWNNISGATLESYDPPAGLIANRWYRRRVISCGETKYSSLVEISVSSNAVPPEVNEDPTNDCFSTTIQLTATTHGTVSGISHRWYATQSATTPVAHNQLSTVGAYVTGITLNAETKSYWVASKVGDCPESARVQVTGTYTPNSTIPTLSVSDVSTDTNRCGSGNFILSASGGNTGSTYEWFTSPTGGSPIPGAGASYQFNLAYENTTNGEKTYWVQGTLYNAQNCPTTITQRVPRTVTVYQLPNMPTNTTANGSICGPGVVNLSALPGANGFGVKWYNASNVLLHTGSTYSPTINETTTFYAETYTQDPICASATKLPITATVTSGITWYLDADNDGFAISTEVSCTNPGVGYTQTVLPVTDCNDQNAAINPNTIWYMDQDNDGLGDPANPSTPSCTQPVGYVLNNNDQCPLIYSVTNNCITPSDPLDQNYVYARTYQTASSSVIDPQFFTQNDTLIQQITYFDALGRPMQQNAIAHSPSPSKGDIITHIGYDGFGRNDKDWLPVPGLSGDPGSYRTLDLKQATKEYYKNHNVYGTDFPNLLAADANPFSEKLFEASPLNRVLQQAAPGEDWKQGSGHEIDFVYGTNTLNPTNPDNDNVRLFSVDLVFANNTYTPTLLGGTDSFYEAGELYKNITKDENHPGTATKLHTTEEFTDKQGRVVLKRTYALVDAVEAVHDTYYVYDDYGNLTYVLPPLMNASTTELTNLINQLAALGYRYVYDHRNRLVEKQIPGKLQEYIIYNKLDQPIMTQDANQRLTNQWLFTKYDAFGRVAYTGKATDTHARHEIQDDINNLTGDLWVSPSTTANPIGGVNVFYNNNGYPTSSGTTTLTEILTINYYDNYRFDPEGETNPGTVFQNATASNVKGMATGSKIKVLDVTPAKWITTVTYYDDKGRPIHTFSNNEYLETVDISQILLDFVGKPLKTKTTHTRNGVTITTLDNYTYDHVGRLLSQTQCIGDEIMGENCPTSGTITQNLTVNGTVSDLREASSSITVTEATLLDGAHLRISDGSEQELIVYNDYDALGQLVHKKVGGATSSPTNYASTIALQTVNYEYNVRGWLTAINRPYTALGAGLFGMAIDYNTFTTRTNDIDPTHLPLYNGNISATSWVTANDQLPPTNPDYLHVYRYVYDALNRIKKADYGRYAAAGAGGNNDNWGNILSLNQVGYDKNGNIQGLIRKGHLAENDDWDNLVYAYEPNSNKLVSVTDNATGTSKNEGFLDGFSGIDYTYDDNGNIIKDRNKWIGGAIDPGITYNHLNLPVEIIINGGGNNGTISYIYDATGTKMRKITTNNLENSVTTTDYTGNFIYEGATGNTQLQFFNHPEGYITPNGQGGYDYVYQYKDHLGNIRLSYTDADHNGTITVSNDPFVTEIVEENNYYPFGLEHKGYNNGTAAIGNETAQRWKFGGKEFDQSVNGTLNTYDFGARNYDPALGRWMNLDPLAEVYLHNTPYGYVENNPIFFVDPDGLRIDVSNILKMDKKGKYVNKDLAEAFLYFANSKVGIEFLSHFAEAGQTIGDYTYDENGEFHSQGMNIAFNATDENYAKGNDSQERGETGPNAVTQLHPSPYEFEKNGKGTININVNKMLNTNNDEARAYKNDPNNPMAKTLYILSRTLAIFHEVIIHAEGYAGDMTDNCLLDCSNINSNLNKYNDGYDQHVQAKQEGSLFLTKVIPAMRQIYQAAGVKRTDDQIKQQSKKFRN